MGHFTDPYWKQPSGLVQTTCDYSSNTDTSIMRPFGDIMSPEFVSYSVPRDGFYRVSGKVIFSGDSQVGEQDPADVFAIQTQFYTPGAYQDWSSIWYITAEDFTNTTYAPYFQGGLDSSNVYHVYINKVFYLKGDTTFKMRFVNQPANQGGLIFTPDNDGTVHYLITVEADR